MKWPESTRPALGQHLLSICHEALAAATLHTLPALTSPAGCAGLWGSGDDRRMLRSMLHSKVQHEHQLDWGSLVTGRNAQVVRRRWRTMLKVTIIVYALLHSLSFQG